MMQMQPEWLLMPLWDGSCLDAYRLADFQGPHWHLTVMSLAVQVHAGVGWRGSHCTTLLIAQSVNAHVLCPVKG